MYNGNLKLVCLTFNTDLSELNETLRGSSLIKHCKGSAEL